MIRWIGIGLLLMSFTAHKFYFSNTEIHHNTELGTLEVTMRLFTDDLERAIAGDDAGSMRLGDEQEAAGAQALVEAYVDDHFDIRQDGSELEAAFIGKEVEWDITWIYLEVEGITSIEGLSVKSNIFTELFSEQINEVHFDSGDRSNSVQLTADHTSAKILP